MSTRFRWPSLLPALRVIPLIFIFAAPPLTSCADRVAPELVITTDSAAYASNPSSGAWVWVDFHNASSHAVLLAACGGFTVFAQIERQQGTDWVETDTPVCVQPYAPLELAPGDGIGLFATVYAKGRYRIRAPLYDDAAHPMLSHEASAAFTLY